MGVWIYDNLFVKFFVFLTHLEEKQQLNDRSLFRKRKNYNRLDFQLLMRSANVSEMTIRRSLLTMDIIDEN